MCFSKIYVYIEVTVLSVGVIMEFGELMIHFRIISLANASTMKNSSSTTVIVVYKNKS